LGITIKSSRALLTLWLVLGQSKGSSRSDTSGKVWSVYLSEADKHDKALADNWKGDSEGILIFVCSRFLFGQILSPLFCSKKTGLFAATVAAFIIESYKRLSSDSGATTVFLLNQISQQLSALSNGTQVSLPPPPIYSDSSFRPALSAIRINILWFLSLTFSLICALLATLMQQWSRRYRQLSQAGTVSHKRARTREYLFEGVQKFGLSRAVYAIPALLHVAVFLFFAGLVDFLFSVDTTVGRVIWGVVGFFGCIYIILTFLPNVRPNCPYRTPLSLDALKWFLVALTAPAFLAIHGLRCFMPGDKFTKARERFQRSVKSLQWTMPDAVESLQAEIDQRALRWAVETVDDDGDIETLIEGIPEFLEAETREKALPIVEELLDPDRSKPAFGHHINRLIQKCTADGYRGTDEKLRRRRALICLDTTRILSMVQSESFFYGKFGDKTWPSVYSLKQDKDPAIAINAISTGAWAACAYVRHIFKSGEKAPNQKPTHINNLRQLINAPCQDADSFPECHLLVLHGFVSSLLPHLSSDDGHDVDPTSFRAVWETLPWILNMAPFKYSNLRSMGSFLALCAGLDAETERATDADDSPIIRLMSILRPMVESMRMQHARAVRYKFRSIVRKKVLPAIRLIRLRQMRHLRESGLGS